LSCSNEARTESERVNNAALARAVRERMHQLRKRASRKAHSR
jgi:hypothetical protein